MTEQKTRAPRNRTLMILDSEKDDLLKQIVSKDKLSSIDNFENKIVNSNYKDAISKIADKSIALLILDPPYNLNKKFNSLNFSKTTIGEYTSYLEEIISTFFPKLKAEASIYICGDWYSSISIYEAASKFFKIRNRITWEREKGRGAKTNWKNCSEDIWFCTVSDEYTFNVDSVKLRRAVIAPYKEDGKPKDWMESDSGKFRDTAPSNLMSDITIPFWSMPENTDHPTQKSEKLIAKLILASSNDGDLVCDPFLGSGTTAVVSKKLKRNFLALEQEKEYCLWAQKRLNHADRDMVIQGYIDNVFWERNTLSLQQKRKKTKEASKSDQKSLNV
jgi:site-specific DNA-methyltransferase (adenine-specific)